MAKVARVAKVAKVAVVANVAIVAEPAAMLDWLSHEGAAVPLDVRTWVTVPAAVYACAVPVPYPTPPFVGVAVEFVPPLAIGKVPDTSVVKDTDPHVGAPEALPCSTWVEVPADVVAIAVVVEPYTRPYWVKLLACPVPPLVTGRVPVTSEVLISTASQLVFVPSV